MYKLNRKIEYALIALKHMASVDASQLVSAKEICELYNTPFDPMARVLQVMAQNGILKAEHGVYGGYQISRDLSGVTFLDLVELVLGPVEIVKCFRNRRVRCDLLGGCNLIASMLCLNERMSGLFKTITVKELITATHAREKTIRNKPPARKKAAR